MPLSKNRESLVEAHSHSTEALQLCRRQEALMGEVSCFHRLATIAISMGNCAAARVDSEQALELARALAYR